MADEIKRHEFAIGPVVTVILRSRHFYSESVRRQRIKSPVEFSAGLVRILEAPRRALNPLALAAACDAQGQELFAPPNVEGWAENGLTPFDPLAWAARYEIKPDQAAEALLDLLLQRDLGAEARALVIEASRDGSPNGLRKVIQRIVNCSEFQMA